MIFLTLNPNLKIKKIVFWGCGVGVGGKCVGVAGVSEFFLL